MNETEARSALDVLPEECRRRLNNLERKRGRTSESFFNIFIKNYADNGYATIGSQVFKDSAISTCNEARGGHRRRCENIVDGKCKVVEWAEQVESKSD